MSKAEERAIEKYPVEMYEEVGWRCVDKNAVKRKYYADDIKKVKITIWQDGV